MTPQLQTFGSANQLISCLASSMADTAAFKRHYKKMPLEMVEGLFDFGYFITVSDRISLTPMVSDGELFELTYSFNIADRASILDDVWNYEQGAEQVYAPYFV